MSSKQYPRYNEGALTWLGSVLIALTGSLSLSSQGFLGFYVNSISSGLTPYLPPWYTFRQHTLGTKGGILKPDFILYETDVKVKLKLLLRNAIKNTFGLVHLLRCTLMSRCKWYFYDYKCSGIIRASKLAIVKYISAVQFFNMFDAKYV